METPPLVSKKSNVNSSTKTSLTPCRRMGLSRRSSLIKQIHQNIKTETTPIQSDFAPENSAGDLMLTPGTGTLTNKTVERSIVTAGNTNINNTLTARRCLITTVKDSSSKAIEKHKEKSLSSKSLEASDKEDPHTFKKRKLIHEPSVDSPEQNSAKDNLERQNSQVESTAVTDEVIRNVLMSIKNKKKMLDTLKVQETYAKKHNVEELKAETARWKAAGQEALRYTVELARDAGYSVTINQLMQQHGFPPHLISYNSDEDEFQEV